MQNNHYKYRNLALSLMLAISATSLAGCAIATPGNQTALSGEITTRSPMNANDGSRYQSFNITLEGGQFIKFTLDGAFDGSLSLQDKKGLLIGSSNGSNTLGVDIPANGRYTLNVSGADKTSYGPFQVNYTRLEVKNSGEIISGTELVGAIVNGNPNTYSFTVTSPDFYQIDLISDDFDSMLELSGQGISLSNDDGGDDLNAKLTAYLEPGTYQIKAKGYSDDVSGQYTLSLNTNPLPEGTVLQNGGELAPSTEITGVYAGQPLRYTLNIAQRSLAVIDMRSDNFDTVLKINGPGTNAEDDDSGGSSNARITTTLNPGQYTITASPYSDSSSGGLFTLETSFKELMPSGSDNLRPGFSLEKTLRANTNNTTLHITNAGHYVIDMISSDFDSMLTIEGQGINESNDDGGSGLNAQLSLYLEPGNYQLQASGYNDQGSGKYVLSVSAE